MIVNNLNQIENKKFTVIIIGSGFAGISTALKLEKKGLETLIIESGNLDFDETSNEFLKVNSIGDHKSDFTGNRLRQFGGSSRIWGGNCNPMNSENFTNWPIKKKDLDLYKNEAREFLKLRNDFFQEKFSKNLNIYNLVWSKVKIDKDYYNHIEKSNLVHLSLGTTFLNFKNLGKKIVSLDCRKQNKNFNLKSKLFVLACGGIENSRLLLWSREKNKDLFNSNLPIGKYYMHHPYHTIGQGIINYKKLINYFEKKNITNSPIITCNNNIFIEANDPFLKKNSITNSGIYVNFKEAKSDNNIIKQLRCFAPKFVNEIYDSLKTKEVYSLEIKTLQEQAPIESNNLNLSEYTDPFGVPLVNLFWKKNKSEILSARIIMEEFGKLLIDEDIGRLALEEHLYDHKIDFDFVSGNHQMGGTRIGTNENDSVVDKNLKVHGTENLFITGSSVFRSSGHCHPTFTIVQLSLRLADNIINYTNKI